MSALAVLEKVVVEDEMEAAFVCFAALPTFASWASLISTSILPSFTMLNLLVRAVAAKLPCHPSGRERRSSLEKRKKSEMALQERGEDSWRDRARERVSSKASLKALEASLGKQRRLTGNVVARDLL